MRKLLLLFPALLAVMTSCGDSSLTRTLPNVTGTTGQVLVVMDKDLWNGSSGKIIREQVGAVLVGLPQAEPAFDILHANPEGFADILVSHRNIILTGTDKSLSQPAVTYERNRWADTQLVIRINAPDSLSLTQCIAANAEEIRQHINDVERNRLISWLTESAGKKRNLVTSDDNSYEIIMPSGYKTDYSADGVTIISSETPTVTQTVIISVSERTTSRIGCIELANLTEKVTSALIKGPDGGSFMVIEKQVPVTCRSFRRNGTDYIEMRGLWTLEGGFMGGPFISCAFIDSETSRAIVMTGFVYAPGEDKRELLRQVEALMYTVRKASE